MMGNGEKSNQYILGEGGKGIMEGWFKDMLLVSGFDGSVGSLGDKGEAVYEE